MDQLEEKKRKGISMMIFSVILGLIGAAFFVVTLYTGIQKMNDGMIRFKVPGSSEITLNDIGDYTIFHEFRSSFDGVIYNSQEDLSGLQVTITEKNSGTLIPLSAVSTRSTYKIGSYSGYSIYNFKTTTPGVYIFNGEYHNEKGSDVILSLGYKTGTMLLSTIGVSLVILFLTIGISVTVFVVGLLNVLKKKETPDSNNNQYYGG